MAHVLVVEDDPTVRHTVTRVLQLDGHTVTTAPNGLAALEQVRTSPPDLIVLDLLMPGVDGWAFAQQCQADPVGHDIPIVVLTGSMRASTAQHELAGTGVRAVVEKPFQVAALRRVVRTYAATRC